VAWRAVSPTNRFVPCYRSLGYCLLRKISGVSCVWSLLHVCRPIPSALSSFSSRIPSRIAMSERHSFSKILLSVSKAVTGYYNRIRTGSNKVSIIDHGRCFGSDEIPIKFHDAKRIDANLCSSWFGFCASYMGAHSIRPHCIWGFDYRSHAWAGAYSRCVFRVWAFCCGHYCIGFNCQSGAVVFRRCRTARIQDHRP